MSKNRLEKKFSETLRADTALWGMKLHNNPLSHQNTPGDYIISYVKNYRPLFDKLPELHLHIVECKQVTLDEDGTGRLAFKRLKQMHDLISFEENNGFHHAWFCIAYKEKFWANSDVYLIPAHKVKELIDKWTFESINRYDASVEFAEFQIMNFGGCDTFDILKKVEL